MSGFALERPGSRLGRTLRVFATLAKNRNLRNVQIAFLAFNAAEYATWIAILLFAYDATGPASVGVVALIQLIPAAAFAPVASSLGDRMRRDRFLVLGDVLITVTLGLVAVAMAVQLHPLLVYALACVAAASMTLIRPAQGAILPALARTPGELTAANGFSAVAEGAGVLIGPLSAAAILVASPPATVFGVFAGVMALATVLAATVRVDKAEPVTAPGDEPATTAIEGIRVLARDRGPRLLVGLLSCRMILIGALDVLFVLMALELFDTGEAGAGFLNAALGAGGMIGGVVTLGLVGRHRLGPALVLGSLSFGACIVLIGLVPSRAAAPILIAVSAIGLSLLDATGRTLLQRAVSDEMLARIFGVLEGLAMASLGVGSILVPVIVAWLGLEGSIVVLGALLPALGLLAIPGLRRIDASAVVPERELALLAAVPMFAPLRPQVLEAVARHASWVSARAGTVLMSEGDVGDRYYVLASGRLQVTQQGHPLTTVDRPGDAVGEIALLFDVPRTATVTVAEDAELLALERAAFLTAVTGHPEVTRAAREVVDKRMTR